MSLAIVGGQRVAELHIPDIHRRPQRACRSRLHLDFALHDGEAHLREMEGGPNESHSDPDDSHEPRRATLALLRSGGDALEKQHASPLAGRALDRPRALPDADARRDALSPAQLGPLRTSARY